MTGPEEGAGSILLNLIHLEQYVLFSLGSTGHIQVKSVTAIRQFKPLLRRIAYTEKFFERFSRFSKILGGNS